jgi:integrase
VYPKKDTTHTLIANKLTVALRARSSVWQCRYNVDGKWQRTSTGERDLAAAKARAHQLLIEANVRKQLNAAPVTRKFKDIANLAIRRMTDEESQGVGKAIYKDYKSAIRMYLIPFFGKYAIDSITYTLIQEFEGWRKTKMEKDPSRSVLMNHNAAMNRIFDEAIIRGFMVEANRPRLEIKGKKSQRRADFSAEEARALLANFDSWVSRTTADCVDHRALLKDYVEILLDTGARPGNELLELTWLQIETRMSPLITPTGLKDEEGDPIELVNARRQVILKIQSSKTGARKSIGRLPTYRALSRISNRNYGKTLDEMIESGSTDHIFQYKEFISDKRIKAALKAEQPLPAPKLLRPTSLNKLFEDYLTDHNLSVDPITGQRRVLYSLRHTYATFSLEHDRVEIHTLAKQMGTSVGMIEQHYSHLDAVKAMHQLHGSESREMLSKPGLVDERYAFDPNAAAKKKKASPGKNQGKKTK